MGSNNNATDPTLTIFPKQLKLARELRGMSQRQLGKLVHCSGPNISRLENGFRIESISLPIAVRMAAALRVNLAWLVLAEGPRDIDAPVMVIQIDNATPQRLRELADQLEGRTSSVIRLD